MFIYVSVHVYMHTHIRSIICLETKKSQWYKILEQDSKEKQTFIFYSYILKSPSDTLFVDSTDLKVLEKQLEWKYLKLL